MGFVMITNERPTLVDFVRGDFTGLTLPAHGDAMRTAGASFLTDAFHAFGTLSPDNRVAGISHCEPCHLGSSGGKLLMSVDYTHSEPGRPTELFLKFSRDFNDAFRDRRRNELEAELHIAALSRLPGFPINVPAACFGDFHRQSGTGLLITQRIPFGSGGIEPLHHKCMDHELDDPLAHYQAIVSALARLAGAHKAGHLSPLVDDLFPFGPDTAANQDPITQSEEQMRTVIARYAAFVADCPQLMPSHLASPHFIARLQRETIRFMRHEAMIKRFLHQDQDFIALNHFNANIDNAWFWRGVSGTLECGLLDWQRARQMNVAYALWGALCGASLEMWDKHLDALLTQFTTELHAHGGPRLDVDELALHLDLYVATMGLAHLIDGPSIVLARLPEAADAESPLDPVFRKSEQARCFLHIVTVFLNLWERRDFGASLDTLLRRLGVG